MKRNCRQGSLASFVPPRTKVDPSHRPRYSLEIEQQEKKTNSCLFNIGLMRIVLVIFISTHDNLSRPLNHSAAVTSVIIRALTQETICQTQNSS